MTDSCPRERLRVIAQALPEVERELQEPAPRLSSLRGLWKALDFDISAEEIDEVRHKAWAVSGDCSNGVTPGSATH